MSQAFYKVAHLAGVILLFLALGAATVRALAGSAAGEAGRKLANITHGVAMLLLLIAGFGLLARLGMSSPGLWPWWMWVKVAIWLALGGMVALLRKKPGSAAAWFWLAAVLGAVAAYLGVFKPT